jgi:hypothetical protein
MPVVVNIELHIGSRNLVFLRLRQWVDLQIRKSGCILRLDFDFQ